MALTTTQVSELYVAIFNRASEMDGNAFWAAKDLTTAEIADAMLATSDAATYFGTSLDTNQAFIEHIYLNTLNKTYAQDTAGVDYWVALLDAGSTRGEVVAGLVSAAQDTVNAGAAQDQFNNRVAVSNHTAATLATAPSDYATSLSFSSGLTVTSDSATVTTANSSVDTIAESASTGTTGTVTVLTTGMDTLTGSANDDQFYGVIDAGTATLTTIQAFDSIDGGNGKDTLNLTLAGDGTGADSAAYTGDTSLTSIEVISAKATGDSQSVDADGLTLTEAINNRSSQSLNFDNLETVATDITVSRVSTAGKTTTATFKDAGATGASDTVTVNMTNVTAAHTVAIVTSADEFVENVTVNVTGSATTTLTAITSKDTTLGNSGLEKLTVTGSGDLTITNAIDVDDTATNGNTTIDGTIDASAFTGKLNVTLDANDMSVTGGSNNDTINAVATLDKYDTINGGAGTDKLTMNQAALTTQFNNVSNVETVAFNATSTNGTDYAIDMSKLSDGVTRFEVDADDNNNGGDTVDVTFSNYTDETIVVKNTTASGLSDANDGVTVAITSVTDTAADTVNFEIYDLAAADALNALDVASFETVNINSTGAANSVVVNTITAITATNAASVVITGANDLTITGLAGSNMTSIDASGMTGKLTATVSSTDDIAVTLAADDSTINFGTTLNNADSVVGGAGTADKVTATIGGTTATTGALHISDVENIELTTSSNSTINLANVTAADMVSFATDHTATVTGLAAGTKVGVGVVGDTSTGTINVTMADASGTNDSLTFFVDNTVGATTDAALVVSNVENVTIDVEDTNANAIDLDISTVAAATITVTGGLAGTDLDLTNAGADVTSTTTTTVDASAYLGNITVTGTTTAMTILANGAATGANIITGSSKADTITISSTAVNQTVDGGALTDTLNITMEAGYTDASTITNVENINVAVKAGDDVTLTTGFQDAVTNNIVITGGNSLSTFTTANDTDTAIEKVDASAFTGNVVIGFATDIFDDTVEVIGGALATDAVTASYTTAGTYTMNTTGVEILNLTLDAAAAVTADISGATGLTTINVTNDKAATFTVDNLTSAHTVVVKDQQNAASVVKAVMADATGSSDSVNIEYDIQNGATAGAKLTVADVETINIEMTTAASIDLSGITITTANLYADVVISGSGAFTLNDATVITDIQKIDGSAMTGVLDLVDGGAAAGVAAKTTAIEVIGGSAADLIAGGTKADTFTGNGGADTFVAVAHANKFIYDTITDAANGDKIAVAGVVEGSGAGTVAGTWAEITLAGAAGFSDYLDEAAKDTGGATDSVIQWFVFDNDTYIVSDNSNTATFVAGTDTVIKLSGVLDLTASTIDGSTATGTIVLDVDGL